VVRDRIPKAFGLDAVRDVQVLCPMNHGGPGARSLNIELQKALNPPGEARVERFGWTFCPGDKVVQVENDYDREVYKGDLGARATRTSSIIPDVTIATEMIVSGAAMLSENRSACRNCIAIVLRTRYPHR
jgi:ATP-dependent exoDNAse (exonuclease V) alpha subunit